MKTFLTFNDIITNLNSFWHKNGCTILQPIDSKVGAATFHHATFTKALNKNPWKAAYTQQSRRPLDIYCCNHSNRLPLFHQYQVIIKPSPNDIQKLYIKSLSNLGIKQSENDIKFIEDNWESPTLGASGVGWEVWLNGIEITQFTYFQQMGGIECYPIMVELAYGLERICMYIQDIFNIKNIIYDKHKNKTIKYSTIFNAYEQELSKYTAQELNVQFLLNNFFLLENECINLINKNFPLIAYDMLIELNHMFNLLDSKSYLASTERQQYISKIRILANKIAKKLKNEN